MVSYSTNLETWGSTGTKPSSDYKFEDDVPPVDVFDNWFHYNVIEDIKSLIDTTNSRIESAKGLSGGEPASPETSHLYHDQDAERLKLWDLTDSSWRQLLFRDGDTLTGALSFSGYNADNVGNITNDNGVTIWDNANEEIPYTNLSNTTVTVAGNNVSIGGSTSVSHGDLSDAPASAHHAKYTDQEAVDAVNAKNSLSVDISGDADTVDGKNSSQLGSGASNDGTEVVSPATDFNFTTNLSVSDDGDGTVTVDGAHSHSLGDLSDVSATGEGDGNGFDADTVDGIQASGLAKRSVGVEHDVYASTSDVPSSITKGEVVIIDGGGLYVEQ